MWHILQDNRPGFYNSQWHFFKKGNKVTDCFRLKEAFESKLPNAIHLEPLNAIFYSSQKGLYLTLLFSLVGIFFLKHKPDHFTALLKSFNSISKFISCHTSPFNHLPPSHLLSSFISSYHPTVIYTPATCSS